MNESASTSRLAKETWRSPPATRSCVEPWSCRAGLPRSWSSPTGAGAAGSARATSTSRECSRKRAWRRSWSTFWKSRRPTTAPGSSTSRFWPAGCGARPGGWRPSLRRPRLRLGYFGASTGAGAALLAAGQEPGLGRRDRLARRPARPGPRCLAPGDRAHPADRRRQRRDRPRAEPRGVRAARVSPPARHRPRCLALVSRAGDARRSRPVGPGVVSPLPDPTAPHKFNSSLDRPERSGYRRSDWSRNVSVVR